MFLIGLTGGIAAGKSTVGDYWKTLGAYEIDADALARKALEAEGVGVSSVVAEFGSEVLDPEGHINRSKLGQIVFNDPEKRRLLEKIVHPLVKKEAKKLLDAQPTDAIVVYNVPLLVEADVDLPFDAVVTVEAPENVRVERLISNRGLKPDEAIARVRSQASAAERANRADYILNSNQPLPLLLKDAERLWAKLEKVAHGTH